MLDFSAELNVTHNSNNKLRAIKPKNCIQQNKFLDELFLVN